MTSIREITRLTNGALPAFTSMGCYPLVYLTKRGETLCAECATAEVDNGNDTNDDPVECADVHWEGPPVTCDECGKVIESAYGEPE